MSRFKPMRLAKWLGTTFVVLFVALLLVIEFFDWNSVRGLIARETKQRLGRELEIAGNLEIKVLRACPWMTAEGVRLDNAAWGSEPRMVDAGRVALSVCLWPLVRGQLHVRKAELSDARIWLEKNEAGVWNTALEGLQTSEDQAAEGEEPASSWRLPVWEHVAVEAVDLRVRQPGGKKDDLTLIVDTVSSERRGTKDPVTAAGKGRVQGMPWDLDATVQTQDGGAKLNAAAHLAQIAAKVTGAVGDIDSLDDVKGEIDVEGKNIGDVAAILGIPLTGPTPAVALKTGFVLKGPTMRVGTIDLTAGETKVGGWLALDWSEARPMLRGVLEAPKLRSEDVAAFLPKTAVAAVEEPKRRKEVAKQVDQDILLLPNNPIDTSALRMIDIDLQAGIKKLEGSGILELVDRVDAKIGLVAGKLTLEPLTVGVAKGVVEARAKIDATSAKSTAVDAEIGIREVDLQTAMQPFIPDFKVGSLDDKDVLAGALFGAIDVTTRGRGVHDFAAGLDGRVGLEVANGRISGALIEGFGFDVTELVGSLMAKKATLPVDCMLADYEIKKGVVDTKAFVIGTPDSNVLMKGKVDLGAERLDVEMRTMAKDFSIGAINVPVDVKGTFSRPKVEPHKRDLWLRALAAVGLGFGLGPAAALLPAIEPGLEKSGRCKDYTARMAQVRQEAAAKGTH